MRNKIINIFNRNQGLKKALFSFFMVLSFVGFSQVNFTASTNRNTVTQGERFQVTFAVNANPSEFTPPTLPQFRIISGPNQSSSMQWVNGKKSSKKSFSYVLVANKVGEYAIGAAKVKVKGKIYTSKPITIKVMKKNTKSNQQQQAKNNTPAGSQNLSQYVFVKSFLNKYKAVVGEQIIATYKLYYKADIASLNLKKLPPFTGFWTETIESKIQNQTTEIINGVRYNVAEIHKVVLFPQRSGDLKIAPLVLDLVVKIKDNQRARSVFDQFFGRYKNVPYVTESKAMKVKVSPLPPKGKPANFSGAVGKFKFSSSLDRNNVKANEAINLIVKIKGSGNLNIVDEPKINFPPDFELYDPKIKNNIAVTANGVSGTKTFEYLIIPRHGGDFEIEPIEFSYYDYRKKKYVTQKSEKYKIHVEKGANESADVSNFSATNKEDIKVIGKDIRFINTSDKVLRKRGEYFFGTSLFYMIFSIPLFLLLGFVVARKKIASYNSNISLVKGRKANKIAKKSLASAEKHLKENDSKAFYEEIFKALYGYISNKLNIDVAQLSKETITQNLQSKGVENTVIQEFLTIIDSCEMARFAPSTAASEQTVYNQSAAIISKIEEAL